jgi:hypothetical protein
MNILIGAWRRALVTGSLLTMGAFLSLGACVAAGPKYPFLNDFCEARASAECSNAVVLACAVPDMPTCVTNRQQLCMTSAPPNTVYNPSAGEGCVDAVMTAYADAMITMTESQAIDAACLPVFNGPGAKGAVCQMDTDCQVGAMLRCVLSPSSTQGTCQIPQIVMGGYSCALPNEQCIDGFHCGSTANCDVDVALGGPCDANDPCGDTLACGASGTCESKSPDGTACTTDGQCLNGICNGAGNGAAGLCVSEITLSPTEPFCVASR